MAINTRGTSELLLHLNRVGLTRPFVVHSRLSTAVIECTTFEIVHDIRPTDVRTCTMPIDLYDFCMISVRFLYDFTRLGP